MKNDLINEIRNEIIKNVDEKVKKSSQRFFKEKIILYGVKTPIINKISKEFFNKYFKDKPKKYVFDFCKEFYKSGYIEEVFIANKFSYYIHKQYTESDIKIFEIFLKKYINNWACCDGFCNHTIGTFLEMYPKYVAILKTWAKSKNRWCRRAASVSLIIPAKKGKFLEDIFEIADILLLDKDDLVQKGYGWLLKVASETYQKEIFDYIIKNKNIMPRTAIRYAIEKMPTDLKKKAMLK
ncbi:MAG: DNA alkylation repair protein [Elusimicrobiota bacterium]|jgi:3-methyladenine DNA glycosylase AlkD|nr:DNA alkylation repair protein [Elusimicrobiota bacterium]